MTSGLIKISLMVFILTIISYLVFLEGIYYFQFKKHKIVNDLISDSLSDTLLVFSLNTYLNCEFKKVAIPFERNHFEFSGKLPIDKNHDFPGIGQINVVAWIDANELNLKNSIFHFEFKSNLPSDRLHFWFQTDRKNKRIANFMVTSPISEFSTFSNGYYVVDIPIGQVDFKCMGTSFLKRRVYGCDFSLEEALENVNVDFGIINLLNNSNNEICINSYFSIKNVYLIK